MHLRRLYRPGIALVGFTTLLLTLQGQSIEHVRAGFLDPPIEYHTVPSWWWDGSDLVTSERIDWQLEQLKSQGIDVVCLIHHVPFNLKPKYQTEAWWKLVQHMVDKAASLEMKVWITDGIAWGSPLINNTVLEDDPSFVGQILSHLETSATGPSRVVLEIPRGPKILAILGAYAYPEEAGTIDVKNARDISHLVQGRKLIWEAPAGEWSVMLFYSKPGFKQEGGDYQSFIGPGRGEPLDYMNPKAMQKLFDVTLGEYERNLGAHLGTTVVATFQDELLTTQGFPAISPYLFTAFRDLKGYDLLPYLGALYRSAGRITPKVHCDYHDVRTHLLEEAFFKPEYEWYEDRGMMITHDQFGRGSLIGQIYQYGDYFRTMRWYQAPGLDDWHEARAGRNLRDIKMAASIAHLYERPRVFSEALHTAGWGLTMEEQRQVVNEEYVMGINLYDEVLFNYSTHGSWFEWAPAATMFRQPYFRHKRLFNDYVNRLSYIMSQGKHVADVAVLYPVTSLQANIGGGGANQKASLISAAYYQLCEQLFYAGIDFDIIDEDSIQRADVASGSLDVAGESFPILVLPPLTAIKRETLAQIRQFYENGGMVVAGTLLPVDSPEVGSNDEQNIRNLQKIFGLGPEKVKEGTTVASQNQNGKGGRSFFSPAGLSLTTKLIRANFQTDLESDLPQILAHHRRIADSNFYLIYNASDQPIEGQVRVRAKGQPEVWDSETGVVQRIHTFREEEAYTALDLAFGPYEALLVALSADTPTSSFKGSDLIDVSLSEVNGTLSIIGRSGSAGAKTVKVTHQGRTYEGSVSVSQLPDPVLVTDQWRFTVEPTLDNRWGDFRLPVTEENQVIGAEIRQFLYRQEIETEDGRELGWTEAGFEDSDWEKVVYTVGPYWWIIPAFHTRGGPAMLDTAFIPETNINVYDTYDYRGEQLRWRPYSFSQQFGIHKDMDYYRSFGVGHYVNVNSNYLDLGPVEAFSIGYAYTHVFSPEEMKVVLRTNAGGYMEPFKVWVNNEVVSERFLMGPIGNIPIQLEKGWNQILLKAMQFPLLHPKHMRFFFHLQPEAEVLGHKRPEAAGPVGGPRLQWFRNKSPFVYDIDPYARKRIGWYRFLLPPGTVQLRMDLYGEAQAFVNGIEVAVTSKGIVRLPQPALEGSVCSLRIEQEQGRYAGAAFRSPVGLELAEGVIQLGDWSEKGLYSYSGIGVYKTDLEMEAFARDTHWELDLGEVKTTAEVSINGSVVGARAWSPYKFDVGDALKEGKNTIQVKVANTLANHGLVGTAWMFIYEGNERSGLIGPVVLRPSRKVSAKLVERRK